MSNIAKYVAEFFGTMILVYLGDSVVANVGLNKTKGQNCGFIVITAAWGLAVMVAVYTVGWISGAHLNPAITLAFAIIGKFPWNLVPGYITGQLLGAIAGAVLVYLTYIDHFAVTDDSTNKLGIFTTIPSIRNMFKNFMAEVLGTAVLLISVLGISNSKNHIVGIQPLLIGLLIW
ncbi:glycerol uptake facilitator protein [Thermohydrogenium kirishiense]|nr:glycerol uptake facilitator protein [Thermohydrogenium kirishiense]